MRVDGRTRGMQAARAGCRGLPRRTRAQPRDTRAPLSRTYAPSTRAPAAAARASELSTLESWRRSKAHWSTGPSLHVPDGRDTVFHQKNAFDRLEYLNSWNSRRSSTLSISRKLFCLLYCRCVYVSKSAKRASSESVGRHAEYRGECQANPSLCTSMALVVRC